MTREEIDEIVSGGRNLAKDAYMDILRVQMREVQPIKFGIKHIDDKLISGANNLIISFGARPSMGKTHLASEIRANLLNENINPGLPIAILDLNWEMQMKSLLLRELKKGTGRDMKDILSRRFHEEEMDKVNEIYDRLSDERVLTFNNIVQGDSLRHLFDSFIAKNQGKEIVVICDHIHILLTKKEIDEFMSIVNEYKMLHTNMTFVIFFQLNREIEKRWRGGADAKLKLNPKNFLPNSGDIYNTDMLFQVTDLMMTMVIPQVVDMDEYTTVNKERYKHLEDHFIPGSDDKNKTVKLKGRNRIYYNFIKIRLNDDFEAPRIYCDVLNPELEDFITDTYYSGVPKTTPTPKFEDKTTTHVVEAPAFPSHQTPGIQAAQGKGFENEGDDEPKKEKKTPF